MGLFGKSAEYKAEQARLRTINDERWAREFAEKFPALHELGATTNTDVFEICERIARVALERR